MLLAWRGQAGQGETMAALRHLPRAQRRWLLLIAVIALLARALVPGGWMPVAGPAGVQLALCDGDMPAVAPAHAMAGMAMPARPGLPAHHHGAPDHPCSFAAAAAALDVPTLPPSLPAPSADHAFAAAAPFAVTIGRGLAAPPPPPTGPPASA